MEVSYIPCSFGVSGMTEEQFEQDQDFIRSIIASAKQSKSADLQ
jgi:hypothetical protein